MIGQITVRKLDDRGRPVWSYQGKLLSQADNCRVVEAHFDRGPVQVAFLNFEPGDRMIEYFYDDRWFNVFEVYDQGDNLKGWYCNLARPTTFSREAIEQQDLALDLVVSPAGETALLDEEEFAALNLSSADREKAQQGLTELRQWIARRQPPFDKIQS